jgi:hypothetical protein
MLNTETRPKSVLIPETFFALLRSIFSGFFRDFRKNLIKAFLATAFTLLLPDILTWLENENLLNAELLTLLREFAVSPQNLWRGCLFSSVMFLAGLSLIEKVWFLGFVKSVCGFFAALTGWLNLWRNTRTTAFVWGIVSGSAVGYLGENHVLNFSLFTGILLAGIVPEKSGLAYFFRFLWQCMFKVIDLKNELKPADEFLRGISPGIVMGVFFQTQNPSGTTVAGFFAVLVCLWLIARFRQKKGKIDVA